MNISRFIEILLEMKDKEFEEFVDTLQTLRHLQFIEKLRERERE